MKFLPLVWAGLWRPPVRSTRAALCSQIPVLTAMSLRTLGGALFDSQLVYSLTIAPRLILSAVALACLLGPAGGLLPAIRAARANIPTLLHEN